jgi:hypothetical protein
LMNATEGRNSIAKGEVSRHESHISEDNVVANRRVAGVGERKSTRGTRTRRTLSR